MTKAIHIDFETYSEAELIGKHSVGGFKYAEDPSTEILILAVSVDEEDAPVYTWDSIDGDSKPSGGFATSLLNQAFLNDWTIYAHNVSFEIAMLQNLCKKTFGFSWNPDVKIYRCTAAMCRRAAIPSQLGQACEFLGLPQQKDEDGKRLIKKFSMPRKPSKKDPRTRILPEDDPEDFQRFIEYCRQDVVAEKNLHRALHRFEIKDHVLDAFHMDLAMNIRGIPVNMDALQKAKVLADKFKERETQKFVNITGYKPTQTAKVGDWARERGYSFKSLDKEHVGKFLEDINREDFKEVHKTLILRQKVMYSAAAKVDKMLLCAGRDDHIRGALLWSGAERTHRWAGRLFQPQNMKRSTKWSPLAYQDIINGATTDDLQDFYGDPLEVIATCIRHFVQRPDGKEMLQADYSAVEARGAAWLCDEEETLEDFRQGKPIYERMGARIFGVSPEHVTREYKAGNDTKRFVGKQAVLGCGYQMGSPRFRETCQGYNFRPPKAMVEEFKPRFKKQLREASRMSVEAEQWDDWQLDFPPFHWMSCHNSPNATFKVWAYKENGKRRLVRNPDNPTDQEWYDLAYDDLAARAVSTFRESNPAIKAAWKSIDTAAKDAIRHPGRTFWGTKKIKFRVTDKIGFRALVMFLPNKHNLIYPLPKLVWKGKEKDGEPDIANNFLTQITFFGRIGEAMAGKADPRFPKMTGWGRCKTYGGSLLENATQAFCGDLISWGSVKAWKAGWLPYMLIHDEAIVPDDGKKNSKNLCNLLCDLPEWAEGFPLEADGNVIPFYMKT